MTKKQQKAQVKQTLAQFRESLSEFREEHNDTVQKSIEQFRRDLSRVGHCPAPILTPKQDTKGKPMTEEK